MLSRLCSAGAVVVVMARDNTSLTLSGEQQQLGLRVSTPQTKADGTEAAGAAHATRTKSNLLTPQKQNRPQSRKHFALNAERLERNSEAPVRQACTGPTAADGWELIRSIRGTHHTGPFVRF